MKMHYASHSPGPNDYDVYAYENENENDATRRYLLDVTAGRRYAHVIVRAREMKNGLGQQQCAGQTNPGERRGCRSLPIAHLGARVWLCTFACVCVCVLSYTCVHECLCVCTGPGQVAHNKPAHAPAPARDSRARSDLTLSSDGRVYRALSHRAFNSPARPSPEIGPINICSRTSKSTGRTMPRIPRSCSPTNNVLTRPSIILLLRRPGERTVVRSYRTVSEKQVGPSVLNLRDKTVIVIIIVRFFQWAVYFSDYDWLEEKRICSRFNSCWAR